MRPGPRPYEPPDRKPVSAVKRRRTAQIVLVALLFSWFAPVAGAQTTSVPKPTGSPAQQAANARQQQAEVRRKKAQLAAQISATEATDRELAEALAIVQAQLLEQEAIASDAKRAADEAREHARQLEEAIKLDEAELASVKERLRNRAVASYVNPSAENDPASFLQGGDFDEAEQRKALASVVNGDSHDLIDELRAVKAKLAEAHEAAEVAITEANQRQAEADQAVADVREARDAQARVKAAVDARLAGERAENYALAAEDASLTQLIQQAEQRQRDQDAAAARAREEAARRQVASTPPRAGTSAGSGAPASSPPAPGSVVRPASSLGLIWPIAGRVSQEFHGGHAGMDIFAPHGTPIYAAKGGTVIFVGMQGGYGNLVVVMHGDGFTTAYAHLSAFNVSVDQSVSQGQLLGLEGSTGRSTGPHLHFETRVNGSAQNPRNYLP